MTTRVRHFGRATFFILLVLCASFLCVHPVKIDASLWHLLEAPTSDLFVSVAQAQNSCARVLVQAPTNQVPTELIAQIQHILSPTQSAPSVQHALAAWKGHTAGLLSSATRKCLLAQQFDDVLAHQQALLFSGFVPTFFGLQDDPYLFATDAVLQGASFAPPGWTLHENHMRSRHEDSFVYLFLGTHLTQNQLVALMDLATAQAPSSPFKIFLSGAPFHTFVSSQQAQKEMTWLSILSLLCVVLIGWRLFHSLRFYPFLLGVLGSSFLVASCAVCFLFSHPHVLTFVFGTALIGLGVDYCYHLVGTKNRRGLLRPLFASLATTLMAFAPLACSSVSVLRQMALFLFSGLLTTVCAVLLFAPHQAVRPMSSFSSMHFVRLRKYGLPLVLVVLLPGLVRVHLSSDITDFYRPTAFLAESERLWLALNPSLNQTVAVVQAPSLQQALEYQEEARLTGLSSILPSLKRQKENAFLREAFVQAKGSAYALSQKKLQPSSASTEFLTEKELSTQPFVSLVHSLFVRGEQGMCYLISPLRLEDRARLQKNPHVVLFSPRETLSEIVHTLTQQTYHLLGLAGLFLVGVLLVLFRRRFFQVLLPTGLALLVTGGCLGYLGVPFNLWTALSFFVLVGLSLDYTIFLVHASPTGETHPLVRASFLSSLIGLGALAGTAFPVTRTMGLTLGLGLFWGYFFARVCAPKYVRTPDAPLPMWHEQPEQSAGALRLRFLWWMYCLLGKTPVKLFCAGVVLFIYPFARTARRSLSEFYARCLKRPLSAWTCYKQLLNFAWSLVDQIDVGTKRKALPQFVLRANASAQHFFERVKAKKGSFLISSHVGCVEVFQGFSATPPLKVHPCVHAFRQMTQSPIFNHTLFSKMGSSQVVFHAVEEIGVETALEMQKALAQGDLVLMAGDRLSAHSSKCLTQPFLGESFLWPKGVFVFAHLMESPIFFITCVRTAWNTYEIHLQEHTQENTPQTILTGYARFLEAEVRSHPEQWYQFAALPWVR